MQYLRLLLLPFSLLYGLGVILRNRAYDKGIFHSRQFDIPVISIGNLAVGGAGKSPMTEFIVRLLKDTRRLAVLSRGYGRKTRGFRMVSPSDTAGEAGDEPLQFRNKFPDVTVAVSEKRAEGIERLIDDHEVIVLDDAFQHRAVAAGLSFLLFDYTTIDQWPLLLPAGNLREPFSSRCRADVLVVTKTPKLLTEDHRKKLLSRLRPFPHQKVFFSYLEYGVLKSLWGGAHDIPLSELPAMAMVFLLTGIANPSPLVTKLQEQTENIRHYNYPDHHPYSRKNIAKLANDFREAHVPEKLIITTEKDAQRLRSPELREFLADLPVYFLPVQARFHEADEKKVENIITDYVSKHLQYRRIH